ncbi:MAG: pyridoxamine 5'-phosphate oxidase family protein [Sarcina sp.]
MRKMRRKDREVSKESAIEILKNGEFGVLSSVGVDNQAYGVPLSYVYLNDAIYFHCAKEGQKIDNINANSKVSFCVVGKTEIKPEQFSTNYESVIILGEASFAKDTEKQEALIEILNKYSKEYLAQGEEYIKRVGDKIFVIKISIEEITGKSRNN